MFTTSQMIQQAQIVAPDWNIEGNKGLLPIFNMINWMMNAHDLKNMWVLNSSTGLPPYLATTASQFEYQATIPTTCRKVSKVFISTSDEGYDSYGTYDRNIFRNREFFEVPITAYPKSPQGNAKVVFRDDPGTTTSYYYLLYYKEPTTISSVATQPDTPSEFHDLMIDGMISRLNYIQHGRMEEWLGWKERLQTEYWEQMNDQPYKYKISPLTTT